MNEAVDTFYNQLAADYHFIFADWRKSVLRQSEMLDRLLRGQGVPTGATVLDCSCGIGTQAIGLAVRGYRVHATDLSPEAVARARSEAEKFRVEITFGVADFRELEKQVAGTFDVVLSCDNSLAHMLTEADFTAALRNMRAKLRPGGLLLFSLRDYDTLAAEKPVSTLPVVTDQPEGRTVVFQVWDWAADGQTYHVDFFTLKQHGEAWETIRGETRLRAWQRAELDAMVAHTGFINARWHLPDGSAYYQPILTAHNPD